MEGTSDLAVEMFADVGAVEVEDLMWLNANEMAHAEIAWGVTLFENPEDRPTELLPHMVNFKAFTRIAAITLRRNCHQNVLRATRQLEQREYIRSARPNFYLRCIELSCQCDLEHG